MRLEVRLKLPLPLLRLPAHPPAPLADDHGCASLRDHAPPQRVPHGRHIARKVGIVHVVLGAVAISMRQKHDPIRNSQLDWIVELPHDVLAPPTRSAAELRTLAIAVAHALHANQPAGARLQHGVSDARRRGGPRTPSRPVRLLRAEGRHTKRAAARRVTSVKRACVREAQRVEEPGTVWCRGGCARCTSRPG